jgi:hypothetical protein
MVKIIRRCVVSGGDLGFRLVQFTHYLANSLDDPTGSVTAFAGLFCRLARLFVDLFAGAVAFGAYIFPGAGGSGIRVVVRRVVAKRIF